MGKGRTVFNKALIFHKHKHYCTKARNFRAFLLLHAFWRRILFFLTLQLTNMKTNVSS